MDAKKLKRQLRAGGWRIAARKIEVRIARFGLPLELPQGVTVDHLDGALVAMIDGKIIATEAECRAQHVPAGPRDAREYRRRGSDAMRVVSMRMPAWVWAALDYNGDRAELVRKLCEAHLASRQ